MLKKADLSTIILGALCVVLLFVILADKMLPKQKTLLAEPQRILFQMRDGKVQIFQGALIETIDSYKIESPQISQAAVDSLGRPIINALPAQVIILQKSSINLINYEVKK